MEISLTAVLVQVIQFVILFWLFKKFLTKPIVAAIEERRGLMKKLGQADLAYEEKIQHGEAEFKKMVQQGVTKKEQLIAEAGALAEKRQEDILNEAKNKAQSIVHDAEQRSKTLEDELKNNFELGVKNTSLLVIKKLLHKDKDLKLEYLDSIVKELV
jgi:F-type H+-transporting ATPase subunit b